MSHPVNDEIFERLYEEVTEEWLENIKAIATNLSDVVKYLNAKEGN